MVIVMQEGASDAQIQNVIDRLVAGASMCIVRLAHRTLFSAPSGYTGILITATLSFSTGCAK